MDVEVPVGYSFSLLDRLIGLIFATEIYSSLEIRRKCESEPKEVFLLFGTIWVELVHVLLNPISK